MENALKPLATDTHDFPLLRRDYRIYVGKTMSQTQKGGIHGDAHDEY